MTTPDRCEEDVLRRGSGRGDGGSGLSVLFCQLHQYRTSRAAGGLLCVQLRASAGRGEIADGEKINVVVPTGNFGNILAAYYAKQMGVPIAKLICASNENKVLFDFFTTGCYDRNREFILTSSPSMDILISSNLERLIYQTAGRDAEKNSAYMRELAEGGRYEITGEMREQMKDFCGGYATEEETFAAIKKMYEKTVISWTPTRRWRKACTKSMRLTPTIRPGPSLLHCQPV